MPGFGLYGPVHLDLSFALDDGTRIPNPWPGQVELYSGDRRGENISNITSTPGAGVTVKLRVTTPEGNKDEIVATGKDQPEAERKAEAKRQEYMKKYPGSKLGWPAGGAMPPSSAEVPKGGGRASVD